MTVGANLGQMLIGVGIGIGILASVGLALLKHLPASKQMEGILLHHSQQSDEGYVSALARADLVGKSGVSAGELRPTGTAVIGKLGRLRGAHEELDVGEETHDWLTPSGERPAHKGPAPRASAMS